jgi:phage shock protein E
MKCRSLIALLPVLALMASGCSSQQPATEELAAPAVAPQSPAGTAGAPAAPAAPGETAAAPESAAPASEAAPIIIDVRTQQEFDAGHVANAILIPYDQMEQRWQELERYRNQPVVLYCRSGRRSGIALEVLKARGFTQLENGGGLNDMTARGYQVTQD